MKDKVDSEALAPLLSISQKDPDLKIRITALDAASRLPLTADAWHSLASVCHQVVSAEPMGSTTRRKALICAARIPLLSLRKRLREMTESPNEQDRDIISEALAGVADPSRIKPLLEQATHDQGESFEQLATMPVEAHITPSEIPPLPRNPVPNASLWRALLLAKLGKFPELDKILKDRESEPELFWGNPWAAYDAISQIRPIPDLMQQHLVNLLGKLGGPTSSRLVQLIIGAATGLLDAEGKPVTVKADRNSTLTSSRHTKPIGGIQSDASAHQTATIVHDTIVKGNKHAAALDTKEPGEVWLGNEIVEAIDKQITDITVGSEWPVAKLTIEQVRAPRPALDDNQMAWVISRSQPGHMIRELTGLLTLERPTQERRRILELAAEAGDYLTGQGGSPYRGAGARSTPGKGPCRSHH